VTTLAGSVFLTGIRRYEKKGMPLKPTIRVGALLEMRPIMLACLAAGLGLVPAALSSGIGAPAQQPLALVVVGGMISATLAILFSFRCLRASAAGLSHGSTGLNQGRIE
jgi:heavy metal efflux system protein